MMHLFNVISKLADTFFEVMYIFSVQGLPEDKVTPPHCSRSQLCLSGDDITIPVCPRTKRGEVMSADYSVHVVLSK